MFDHVVFDNYEAYLPLIDFLGFQEVIHRGRRREVNILGTLPCYMRLQASVGSS